MTGNFVHLGMHTSSTLACTCALTCNCGVANPPLVTIELPAPLYLLGSCLQGGCIAAIAGLSQAPGSYCFQGSHVWEKLALLLL